MNFYQDYKSFYQSNILLLIILLFVIVYVIINWNKIINGNYFSGNYTKSILITGIIFLILHMIITWDDNVMNTEEEIIDIPKYKFQNNLDNDEIKNEIIAANANLINQTDNRIPVIKQPVQPVQSVQQMQSLNNKYKSIKNFDIKPIKLEHLNNNKNIFNNFPTSLSDDAKLSNRNIFITHKNSSRYGLKF